jgi:hypothetical protein
MLILSEKIPPPPRSQIFNDSAAQDAALRKSLDEVEDRRVKQFIDDLAGEVRPPQFKLCSGLPKASQNARPIRIRETM